MLRPLILRSSTRLIAHSRRSLSIPLRPQPVRLRLPEDEISGSLLRSIPKWFKKEGDFVKSGEPVCEVDAGDVGYEFNSPVSGWIVRIIAQEGSNDLKGGEIIAYLASGQDQITSVSYDAAKEIAEHRVVEHGVSADATTTTTTTTTASVTIDELTEWLRKIGGNDELLEYKEALLKEGFSTIEAMKTLEENDLDPLGITKRGHRKVLLHGVAVLNGKG